MIESNFDLEKELNGSYDFIIGIDEAGRGPLAGPVVAGAVFLKDMNESENTEEKLWHFVRDSKTLSEKKREELFDFIQEKFWVGVGICDHKTIDRINILEASFLAMKKAVVDLKSKLKDQNFEKTIILLDGNKKIPNLSEEQRAIIGGDKYIKSISAASIVAKVTRDRIMLEFHEKRPEYQFNRHKGYGTKLHLEALRKHGPSEIHRQSFKPVSSLAKS